MRGILMIRLLAFSGAVLVLASLGPGCSSHRYESSAAAPVYRGVETSSMVLPPPPEAPPAPQPPGPRQEAGVATSEPGRVFPTPEAAMSALSDVLGQHDQAKLEDLFGPGATDVLWSGDDVADVDRDNSIRDLIREGVVFEQPDAETTTAVIGKDEWPFANPLVRSGTGWRFDLASGAEELLDRRIGRFELGTIATMYEYVEAQNEYRDKQHDGNPKSFAQRLLSTEGKHDGLYWYSAPGEEDSPFGPYIAEVGAEASNGDD